MIGYHGEIGQPARRYTYEPCIFRDDLCARDICGDDPSPFGGDRVADFPPSREDEEEDMDLWRLSLPRPGRT